MPEATVNKNSELGAMEDEIRTAGQRSMPAPSGNPRPSNDRN
jgi:hypothetical protein